MEEEVLMEEYEQTSATALGKNKMELSTGLILASSYADKLRRVALVSFSKIAPRGVIIRDVSELNKQLYEKIVNEMKIDKLSVIKILVDAEYDEQNKKLVFSNVRILRYYSEEETKKLCEGYEERIRELEGQLRKFKERVAQIEKLLSNDSNTNNFENA